MRHVRGPMCCVRLSAVFVVEEVDDDKEIAKLVAATHVRADLSHFSKERVALSHLLKREGGSLDRAANALLDTFACDIDLLVESLGGESASNSASSSDDDDDDDDDGDERPRDASKSSAVNDTSSARVVDQSIDDDDDDDDDDGDNSDDNEDDDSKTRRKRRTAEFVEPTTPDNSPTSSIGLTLAAGKYAATKTIVPSKPPTGTQGTATKAAGQQCG
jgi:hypothetical protein